MVFFKTEYDSYELYSVNDEDQINPSIKRLIEICDLDIDRLRKNQTISIGKKLFKEKSNEIGKRVMNIIKVNMTYANSIKLEEYGPSHSGSSKCIFFLDFHNYIHTKFARKR